MNDPSTTVQHRTAPHSTERKYMHDTTHEYHAFVTKVHKQYHSTATRNGIKKNGAP